MLVYGTETIRAKLLMDNSRNSSFGNLGSGHNRSNRKYKMHRKLPLQSCLVLDYDSSVAFVVVCPGGKSFVAMAASGDEKQVYWY